MMKWQRGLSWREGRTGRTDVFMKDKDNQTSVTGLARWKSIGRSPNTVSEPPRRLNERLANRCRAHPHARRFHPPSDGTQILRPAVRTLVAFLP